MKYNGISQINGFAKIGSCQGKLRPISKTVIPPSSHKGLLRYPHLRSIIPNVQRHMASIAWMRGEREKIREKGLQKKAKVFIANFREASGNSGLRHTRIASLEQSFGHSLLHFVVKVDGADAFLRDNLLAPITGHSQQHSTMTQLLAVCVRSHRKRGRRNRETTETGCPEEQQRNY